MLLSRLALRSQSPGILKDSLTVFFGSLDQWASAANACIFDECWRRSSNQKFMRAPRLRLRLAVAYLLRKLSFGANCWPIGSGRRLSYFNKARQVL